MDFIRITRVLVSTAILSARACWAVTGLFSFSDKVDSAAVFAASSFEIESLTQCAAVARVTDVVVFCYDFSNSRCSTGDFSHFLETPTPQVDDRKCYEATPKGCDGKVLGYEEVETFCNHMAKMCTWEGWNKTEYSTPMASGCPADFDSTNGNGCLFIGVEQMTFCDARLECKKKGADLASPATEEDAENLRQTLEAMSVDSEVWAGLIRLSLAHTWGWIRNGRSPGPDKGGDWTDRDPDGPDDLCSRLVPKHGFGAGDTKCTEKRSYICEVWN